MKKLFEILTKGKLTAMLCSGAGALFLYILAYYLQDYVTEPILKAILILSGTLGVVFSGYFIVWLLFGVIINPIRDLNKKKK